VRLNAGRPEQDVVFDRLPVSQKETTGFNPVNLGARSHTNPEPSENRFGVEPGQRWETRKYSATGFKDAYSAPAESPAGLRRCFDPSRAASYND
jgi:hypothetical protein